MQWGGGRLPELRVQMLKVLPPLPVSSSQGNCDAGFNHVMPVMTHDWSLQTHGRSDYLVQCHAVKVLLVVFSA